MPQNTPPMENVAPPQDKDIQERIDGFNKELLPLLGKYELGLAAMPKIMQDGRVFADPIIVSVRGKVPPKPVDEVNSKAGLAAE